MNVERLKELFEPDYDKGTLVRKIAVSNRVAGENVGWTNDDGYVKVGIDGGQEYIHRILWTMYHGVEPSVTVDHRDGNPSNNAITNLRLATQQQQTFNRGMHSNNTSGIKGVSFCKLTGKWRAEVKKDGVKVLNKRFPTAHEAQQAAEAARAVHHAGFERENLS